MNKQPLYNHILVTLRLHGYISQLAAINNSVVWYWFDYDQYTKRSAQITVNTTISITIK